MGVFITGSKKNEHGEITIYFANERTDDWYYAHSISSIGRPDDQSSRLFTAWAWIDHMRNKNWWNNGLEVRFLKEVSKHFTDL